MWSGSFSDSNIGQHPSFSAVVGSLPVAEEEFSDAPDIKQGATDGGSFGPGGCVVTECTFTISNGDGKFSGVSEGQDVTVSIGDDLMFTGSVCDIERQRSTIAVTCYGPMRTLDKKKFGTHTFTETTTVADIIGWIESDSGVTIHAPSAGGNIVVNLPEDTAKGLDLTCRQALQEVMQISGNFARDSRDGSIYCGWFDFSNVQKTFTEDTYYACAFKQAQEYTGVQIGSREVNGTAAYLWRLDANDFLTDDNAEAVETRLAGILVGTSFSAGSLTALTDPRIEAGDVLSVTFAHGGSTSPMVFPVTSLTITNGLKESFSAEAMTADEAEDQRQKQSSAIANAAKQAARNSQANARGGSGSGASSGSGSGSGSETSGSGDYIATTNGTGTGTTLTDPLITLGKKAYTYYHPIYTDGAEKSKGKILRHVSHLISTADSIYIKYINNINYDGFDEMVPNCICVFYQYDEWKKLFSGFTLHDPIIVSAYITVKDSMFDSNNKIAIPKWVQSLYYKRVRNKNTGIYDLQTVGNDPYRAFKVLQDAQNSLVIDTRQNISCRVCATNEFYLNLWILDTIPAQTT